MAKIFPALTLLFALVATYLGFESKARVEKLKASADTEHTTLLSTQSELKTTKDKLKTTEGELAEAKAEMEKTKATLATTEAELQKAKGELEPLKAELDQSKMKLADLQKVIDDMKGNQPGVDPKVQIEQMKTQMTDLENKNKELEIVKAELTTRVETLQNQKKDLDAKVSSQSTVINRYQKGIMQQGTRGRVLAVNAGWGFCVLSIGDRQGAAANKTLIVSRGGRAIGRVKIINVETSQSVADIIPSSFIPGTYVEPGDEVIFTGENKVQEEPAGDAATASAGGGSPTAPPLPQR